MRKFLFLVVFTFTVNCTSTKQINGFSVKTHKTEKYVFNYHYDWYKFKKFNKPYFTSSRLSSNYFDKKRNYFTVLEKKITKEFKSIEDIALNDIEISKSHFDNVSFLLSKKMSKNDTIYILERLMEYQGVPYKTFGHYRQSGDIVYGLFYNFQSNIYGEFLDQAHIMFNSFKFID